LSDRFKHLEIHQRETDRTEEEVEQVAGTPVRPAEHYVQLAVDACRLGRFETSLQMYTRASRENRGLVRAWVGQIQMLVQLGELAEARLWSDKSLELFKNNGELLAGKAQACARQGDHRAAMACSDASLQCPGSSPARWQARGEVLLASRGRRSRDCFERSLADAQADWFDRVIVARIYLYYRRATAALQYAEAAARLRPTHVYCWFVVGQCQEAMGWFDQAETSYERCAELSDDFPEARSALGAIRSRTLLQRSWSWLGGLFRR
jgi:tetratricopeptide (TPR) repeat protein